MHLKITGENIKKLIATVTQRGERQVRAWQVRIKMAGTGVTERLKW
jgi:hypothetical protein